MKCAPVSRRRKGLALALSLVALACVAVILAVVTAQIVAQRQMMDQRQRQLQADWLARSGVELAAARLLEKPGGFTLENKESFPDGRVRIVVEKVEEDSYTVTVEAEVGARDEPAVARTLGVGFRRVDSDGVVRLLTVPVEKKKS